MIKINSIVLIIIFLILLFRLVYLYFDDTHILNIIDRDNIYRTIYNDNKLIFNYTDDFDLEDEDYYKYLSLCENEILQLSNDLRKTELKKKNSKKISEKIIITNLNKLDYVFQRLGYIDTFLFKIPILEELNDRITFYYNYMNDSKYIKINNIPV